MANAKLFDGNVVSFDSKDIKGIDFEEGDEGSIFSFLIRWNNGEVDRAENISL